MATPVFMDNGDMPPGIHPGTLREVIARFGTLSPNRMLIALRLERTYRLAAVTGQLARFIVFGSFITAKEDPNDVDIFMLMEDTFDASQLSDEAELLFDHNAAQTHFGASVFWLRKLAAFEGEEATVQYWQVTREGGQRGIIEIIPEPI